MGLIELCKGVLRGCMSLLLHNELALPSNSCRMRSGIDVSIAPVLVVVLLNELHGFNEQLVTIARQTMNHLPSIRLDLAVSQIGSCLLRVVLQ